MGEILFVTSKTITGFLLDAQICRFCSTKEFHTSASDIQYAFTFLKDISSIIIKLTSYFASIP